MIQLRKLKFQILRSRILTAAQQASLTPLMEAGYMTQRQAKKSMRPYRGKASKPGKPPKSRTKKLKKSIRTGRDRSGLVVTGPTREAFYGRALEKGTSRMAAHPFMKPALEKVRAKFPGLWKGKSLSKTPEGKKLNRWRMSR